MKIVQAVDLCVIRLIAWIESKEYYFVNVAYLPFLSMNFSLFFVLYLATLLVLLDIFYENIKNFILVINLWTVHWYLPVLKWCNYVLSYCVTGKNNMVLKEKLLWLTRFIETALDKEERVHTSALTQFFIPSFVFFMCDLFFLPVLSSNP